MSLDLRPIVQPFPDARPFYDIREFLVNGWASVSNETFAVRPDGNALDLMLRVRGDNATSSNIAQDIPFAPPYTVRFPAYFDGTMRWVILDQLGRLAVLDGITRGELSGIVRMPMKK